MTISRRAFLGTASASGLALASSGCAAPSTRDDTAAPPPLDRPTGTPNSVAQDEAYWRRVAGHYRVSPDFTNLEAGYFGMMASPVLAEYHRQIDRVNIESSHYARGKWNEESAAALARLADFLGAAPEELVFTRNATEALQRLIVQYNGLRPGDEVMYADLDYNAMQFAMEALAELRGVSVVRIEFPEPASRDNVMSMYADALTRHPKVRLLLLTHLNNKTGLIIPTREIVALARSRGVDTIVDAAHSFGQVDITIDDIGADFVGLNLHKWLGAPIGVGAMYIKADRLADIDRMLGDDGPLDRIESRMHTGTANFATWLTVPAALDFHDAVGPAYKAARLRLLRDTWVSAVRGTQGIDILAPDDHDLVAAITSFRMHGRTTKDENQAIVRELFEQHRLFTVWRTGLARGDCVRVTPALYNTPADAERLAQALTAMAARG
ncbi:MAG: aminotransferase class V-fold PLP-dependent enzyme [Gemmatimonadales bacterium]|nr:aminotransferase class V-fold PLP-dependent enzyme [Gemmatimonadales bacterium]MDZ4390786.1 aminotransferase class V-fold PLP-dependent enzyme [Gemmatimonadales bacterium]